LKQFPLRRGISLQLPFPRSGSSAWANHGFGRFEMTTTTLNRKKSRLRVILLVAAAIGTSSATLSGALATLALQEVSGSQATAA
jgi:hypothetical protein